MNIFDLS